MRRIRLAPNPAVLYSAGLPNTLREAGKTRPGTSATVETSPETPDLYSVYSVVFSGHLHTNSACKPYSRKGFGICIQCIQRIPTPFVFRFSLLLEREYMNTVNTRRPRPVHGDLASVATGSVRFAHAAFGLGFVFSGLREYMPPPSPIGSANAEIAPNRARHTPFVFSVFSCIQRPNAYKFGLSALLL